MNPIPWKPRPYQERAVKAMISNPAFGLLLDPGLGKTSITLAALKLLQRREVVRNALVIAPVRVAHAVWPGEAVKWKNFSEMTVSVLHGAKKAKLLAEPADVYVVNPEGLQWLSATAPKSWWPEMLVIDESTRFKHTRTQRFRTLRALLSRFDRRYILTGTPAPNGLLDLFGQIYVLDGGERLGKFITHYRQEYFMPVGYRGYQWVLQRGAEKRIYKQLKGITLRLDAEDYLKMPKRINTTIGVDLPTKAMAQYKVLEEEFVMALREGEVTAMNAGVRSGKCRQVAGGSVYLDPDPAIPTIGAAGRSTKRWAKVHGAKLDALRDLIEELSGQPTIIAYEYGHERELIKAVVASVVASDAVVPVVDGTSKPASIRKVEAAWNAGELPVIIGHPKSLAHGLNLQYGGHSIIWYTPTWDLELYDQLNRRVWRPGQKRSVMIYHLVAKRTVDLLVMQALKRKDRSQRSLLDVLKESYIGGKKSRTTTSR